jgi:hypothetical protein
MVAQRRYRIWEQRDKRESRERQNPEGERRPKELRQTMLLGGEGSIVSGAQQTRTAPFFAADIVLAQQLLYYVIADPSTVQANWHSKRQ